MCRFSPEKLVFFADLVVLGVVLPYLAVGFLSLRASLPPLHSFLLLFLSSSSSLGLARVFLLLFFSLCLQAVDVAGLPRYALLFLLLSVFLSAWASLVLLLLVFPLLFFLLLIFFFFSFSLPPFCLPFLHGVPSSGVQAFACAVFLDLFSNFLSSPVFCIFANNTRENFCGKVSISVLHLFMVPSCHSFCAVFGELFSWKCSRENWSSCQVCFL